MISSIALKLRLLAPYAAIELFLPGGSLMALALWLYRRHADGRPSGSRPGQLKRRFGQRDD